MGVNFQQKCMVGIEIPLSEIRHLVIKATYEDQNRYDPRTGKILKTEKVLVKHPEFKYVFMGEESDDWCCMIENIAAELDLDSYVQEDDSDGEAYFCIGTFIGDERDMGRVDLLEGSVEISYLVKLMTELKDKLPGDISLHFLSSAG